ncbi:hypothetical protein BDL97_18G076800 [Sphagnum fallax]|nr:hypothetical protein BDL97_18G076800 [Sphagnum fallax]
MRPFFVEKPSSSSFFSPQQQQQGGGLSTNRRRSIAAKFGTNASCCFLVFVFSLLIFTALTILVAYKGPDPWMIQHRPPRSSANDRLLDRRAGTDNSSVRQKQEDDNSAVSFNTSAALNNTRRSLPPLLTLSQEEGEDIFPGIAAESLATSSGGGDPNNIFFRHDHRYLYYTRGADYCKSMSQYMWSLLCALGEARFLNRSFVMDLDICLPAAYNPPSYRDEPGKDFRFYFDYGHLQETTSVIEKQTFEKEREEWLGGEPNQNQDLQLLHHHPTISSANNGITELHVSDHHAVKPALLLNETSIILFRHFVNEEESKNYWYRVCEEDDAEEEEDVAAENMMYNYIERPWNSVWKAKPLMNIVMAICNKLEWDFDVVHVVRGAKASNKDLWPNLETDTSSESLLRKLWDKIEERRTIFIATDDELDVHYLHRLKTDLKVRYNVFVLDDFEYLWAKDNSQWYTETTKILANATTRWEQQQQQLVALDGYMRMVIESELLYRGKTRIETFNDLTQDCENGDKSCK